MTQETETPALSPNLPAVPVLPELPAASISEAPRVPARRRGGLLEWVFRRRVLAEAREKVVHAPARQRELHRRAKLAQELADRMLEPVDPLRAGDARALAAGLYREAAYWALSALRPSLERPSPKQLWAASDPALLLAATDGNAEELELVRRFFNAEPGFVEIAELGAEEQLLTAKRLQNFASRVLRVLEQPQAQIERLEIQRLYRSFLAFLVLGVLSTGAGIGIERVTRKPDIALGKPWRASSSWAVCHPEIPDCGGSPTKIFFHTNNDDNPWFEYDFGAPVQFSSLTIKNRSDYGPDRAIPLILEVSNDGKTYKEVLRRTETFNVWKPKFRTQTARYLRLRVPKVTPFHLELVQVHK